MPELSPRSVVELHLTLVSKGITGALAEDYTPDAVVELPFLPGGGLRLQGREALRSHFERAASMPLELQVQNLVVYETSNRSVIVAEYDYQGRVTTTGSTFTVANVQVFGIRSGKIAWSRDYHDHATMAAALRS